MTISTKLYAVLATVTWCRGYYAGLLLLGYGFDAALDLYFLLNQLGFFNVKFRMGSRFFSRKNFGHLSKMTRKISDTINFLDPLILGGSRGNFGHFNVNSAALRNNWFFK